ncbi:hypothetical protein ACTHPH_23295 [Paenibacillus pasadenensis]|uniref:Uncharacterized protein n=1 Tax=Paenibacillus pasadenensis TaxID=217090 RepID=A0A2N5N102_9BACL|nr:MULTISPECIES: hypothetical protein [Paenibacillus]PLT44006.1 hypothetical protein B8V81_2437 [Paenibacillus pasadenensis]QGG54565.1 hypothetical protein GE073_02390 [Paenibacillus sp. B01]
MTMRRFLASLVFLSTNIFLAAYALDIKQLPGPAWVNDAADVAYVLGQALVLLLAEVRRPPAEKALRLYSLVSLVMLVVFASVKLA